MATFELPPGSNNSTAYTNGVTPRPTVIIKVTDDQSDQVFNVGDTVKVTFSTETASAEYVGTVSVTESGQTEAQEFMVLKIIIQNVTFHYLVGVKHTDAPSTIVETGNSANLTAESFTVCFFPGTLIATPSGERKVEELVSGDPVLVGDLGAVPATWIARIGRKFRQRLGFARDVPVKWIGRQMVSAHFGPADRLMPVRFAAGSLGGGGGQPSAA